jgi:hypothetical protein
MSVLRSSLVVFALIGIPACSADRVTDPSSRTLTPAARRASAPSPKPQFLQPAANAPAIANPIVQFWAKRGVDTTAQMVYHAASGATDSVVFFSLRLRARSLWKRPDGSTIANGDSVLITLTLVDEQKGIVDCQPSGLRFDPDRPARVRISFAESDPDVNDDGVVNAADSAITRTFAVWRKESTTDPWLRLASFVSTSAQEVEAEIGGFTSYAIAW